MFEAGLAKAYLINGVHIELSNDGRCESIEIGGEVPHHTSVGIGCEKVSPSLAQRFEARPKGQRHDLPNIPVGAINTSSPNTALVVPPISSKLGSLANVMGAGSSRPRSSI